MRMNWQPRLLLISSSRTHGTGFLEHCRAAMAAHLDGGGRLLFVPFALAQHDLYADRVRQALQPVGIEVDSLHTAVDPVAAVERAAAVFTGGGNTFRLLKTLYDRQLLEPLRQRIGQGMPYMGSSAGTNIAGPTIRTTNDMPIVQPPDFAALGVVPFQINPHFVDARPDSTHQGETREQRLAEYLEENDVPVAGIREGCWLEVREGTCVAGGENGGLVFARNQDPRPFASGQRLDDLLTG